MAIPKGLEPTGVILVDKPAGPSSFAVLAGVRSRTRAKTGHAGTLDPFATGLLILLSGRATTMASCFVGLPKRYLTDVDLSRRTTTGDPEGEPLDAHESPRRSARVRARGPPRRDRASDPDGVGRQDRGRARLQAAPAGRRRRDAPPALAGRRARRHRVYRGHRDTRSACQLRHLREVDRRCARWPLRLVAADGSRAVLRRGGRRRARAVPRRGARSDRADASPRRRPSGSERRSPIDERTRRGRRARRSPSSGRRTGRGPIPGDRYPGDRCRGWRRRAWPGGCRGERRGRRMRIAHAPGQLERQPRAVAIGTFDGVHRGHLSVIQAAIDSGLAPTVITFDPHPRVALGNEVELITTLERRLELFALAGRRGDARGAVHVRADGARARDVRRALPDARSVRGRSRPGPDFRFGAKRRGDLDLLGALGFEILEVVPVPGVSSSAIRTALREGDVGAAAALLGRPFELDGIVVAGDQRGGTLGYPTANLALEPRLACPSYGIYAGSALGHRAAISIGTNPHYGGTGAPDRAVPARLRRRPLRQAARRRGVGAAARRGGVRLRGGARSPRSAATSTRPGLRPGRLRLPEPMRSETLRRAPGRPTPARRRSNPRQAPRD